MRRCFLVGVLVPFLVASCSGGGGGSAGAEEPAALRIPSQVIGLRVVAEDVSEGLEDLERPYVDSVAVFSFREDDLLRATLQAARFNRAARPDDRTFQGTIVNTIGGRSPVELKMGDTIVYSTVSSAQQLYVWFSSEGFFVLGISDEYPFPRTLLRRLIERDLEI